MRTAASEKVRLHPNPTGFDDPADIIIFENEFGLLQIDGRPSLLSRSLYEITSCRLYGLKNFSLLSFSLPMDNAGDSHVGQPGATNAGQDQGATGGMNLGNSALGYVMVDTGQGAAPAELRQGGVQPAAFFAAGAAAAAGTHTTAPPAPQGPYPQLGLELSPELLNAVMGVPAGTGAAAQPATLGGGGVPQNGPAIAPAAAGTNTLAYPNFGNDLPQTTFNSVILIRHVTSCFVHEQQLRLLMTVCLCTSHTDNLASVVGTCLWPHSPATLRPCRGVFGTPNPSGSALPGAMLGAAAGAASAGSVALRSASRTPLR